MIRNKRGQGLSTSAIILIVLGVIILTVLIIGFSAGWDKIAPWLSSENVDTVVDSCKIACSVGGTYDFCSKERTLKSDDLPNGVKEVKGNCTFFSTSPDYTKYSINPCPGLCE